MITMAKARIWLLTSLNVLVAVWALIWLLGALPATRGLVPFEFAYRWMLAVFLGVPVGILLVTVMGLGKARTGGPTKRAYFRFSYIVSILAWILVCLPSWFFIEAFEPWPISLRQGPDTDHARAGFERALGFPPLASITPIYYRSVGFQGGTSFLRFDFVDPELIDQITVKFDLIEVPEEALSGSRHRGIRARDSFASWWIAEEINATDLIYVDRDTYDSISGNSIRSRRTQRIIWIDSSKGRAYYKENGF